jgi:DNA-binding response OmpR family regulator
MSRRVLAVDDQQEILDVVRLAIETTTDWAVTTTTSGRAAVDDHAGERYDVVLLDVTIPGEDARRTAAALHHNNVGAALVLLTAADVDEAFRRSVGADAVITKPFDPMRLAAAIGAVLG